MKRILVLFVTTFICLTSLAQIQPIIPYQGHIADTSGKAYDGNYTFSFRILDQNNASQWSSGDVSIAVANGNYSVSLGSTGQPAIDRSVFNQDVLFLEISFNDGINGKETLSPNVRILPVPYAMRAAVADSSKKTRGFQWGDSLVLRDASGDVRFVLNPNHGEFRMMKNDTSWLSMRTNSNVISRETLPNGGYIRKYYSRGENGERFVTTQTSMSKDGPLIFDSKIAEKPKNGKAFYIVQQYVKYCTNKVSLNGKEYEKTVYKYLRDTIEDNFYHKKAGIHTYESWWDCSTGKYKKGNYDAPGLNGKNWDSVENKKEETMENGEHKVIVSNSDQDTFQRKVNPKTGEATQSNELTRYVLRLDGGQTFKTYYNDSTNKNSSTTVDPDNKTTVQQNQDNYLWIPETNEQCFGVAIGGTDTFRWYVNNTGFEFEGKIVAEEVQTPVVKYEVDNSQRYQFRVDSSGKSTESFFDALGNEVKRVVDPKTGLIILEGGDRQLFQGKDLAFGLRLDTNKRLENSIVDKQSGKELKLLYDAGKNAVRTEANKTAKEENHRSDSAVTVTYEWLSDPSKYFVHKIDPKNGLSSTTTPQGTSSEGFSSGTYTQKFTDSLTKSSLFDIINFSDSSRRSVGWKSSDWQYKQRGIGFQFYDTEVGIKVTDEQKKRFQEIIFGIIDSTLRLIGTQKLHVEIPKDGFTTVYEHSNSFMSETWDFGGKSKFTEGLDNSIFGFNSGATMILESQSFNSGSLVTIDSSGNPLALEMMPDQQLAILSAGRNPATLAADNFMVNENINVQDSGFINTYLGVNGNVDINGNLIVAGNISKGGGTFRIDHPVYPDEKYLYHSFIESPDMMNVYNGNIKTGEDSTAVVELPEYFGALNMDFRYQLTSIGTFAQAIVLEEIDKNKFVIKTDKANVKVSWQVTGIRKDDYANDHRVEVEVDKEPEMMGKRLYTPKSAKQ